MTFFDKIERNPDDVVYTIIKIKSVTPELEPHFHLIKELPFTDGSGFYKTTVKHLKYWDPIFTENYVYVTHRNS